MSHTPGPWGILGPHNISFQLPSRRMLTITKPNGMDLAFVCGDDQGANARLIAAAPDLLEVLPRLLYNAEQNVRWLRKNVGPAQGQGMDEIFAKARAAIAKATGQEVAR